MYFYQVNRLFSFDIVDMILRIDIHRYTDKNASVLSLKKKKNKKTKKPQSRTNKGKTF